MSKHTPEPWRAEMNSVYWEFQDTYGDLIGDTCASSASEPHHGCSLALGEANANRLVACVNALAGVPDPAAFVAAARELADASTNYEQASFGTVGPDTDRLMKAVAAFHAADRPNEQEGDDGE